MKTINLKVHNDALEKIMDMANRATVNQIREMIEDLANEKGTDSVIEELESIIDDLKELEQEAALRRS